MNLHTRAARLSSIRAEAREVDFVCSTEAVDSYGEIVRGWRLDRFASNPVALFGHDSKSLPIGSWKNVRVAEGKLVGTLCLASAAANPVSENVMRLIVEGALRAVSVGFIPSAIMVEKIDGKDRTVLADNELMEISVVPIPANPDATIRARAAAQRAADDGEDLASEVNRIARGGARRAPAPGLPGVMVCRGCGGAVTAFADDGDTCVNCRLLETLGQEPPPRPARVELDLDADDDLVAEVNRRARREPDLEPPDTLLGAVQARMRGAA